MAEYVNVHGQPLRLSAKDAVLAREPGAFARKLRDAEAAARAGGALIGSFEILSPSSRGRRALGAGATEEAAWREALSRMRVEDEERMRRHG